MNFVKNVGGMKYIRFANLIIRIIVIFAPNKYAIKHNCNDSY